MKTIIPLLFFILCFDLIGQERYSEEKVFFKEMLCYSVEDSALLNGVVHLNYPTGQLKQETSYRNGIKNGPYKTWDDDGKLTNQANYVDGKEEKN